MPDRIEIAASGRAKCRACRRVVGKGEERFAEAVPNPVAEGESQHYYHLMCAAERRPKALAGLLASLGEPREDQGILLAAATLATEHHRLERLGVLERAKSARANCRHCREPIDKDTWRVAIQPIEEGRAAAWGFVHLHCVGAYCGIKPELARLVRYTDLTPEESGQIAELLAALPIPEPLPEAPVPEPLPEAPRNAAGDALPGTAGESEAAPGTDASA